MFKRLKRCILQSELFDQTDFTILHVKNIAAPVRSSLREGSRLCVSEFYNWLYDDIHSYIS